MTTGSRTCLSHRGPWDGDDIPGILLDQPACAEFICRKLFRHFVSETATPSDALIAPRREGFSRIALSDPGSRGNDSAFKPLLRSECTGAVASRVRSSSPWEPFGHLRS